MLKVVLEKMLLEENFMINTMNEIRDTTNAYELTEQEVTKIEEIQNKILEFFSIYDDKSKNDFFNDINSNNLLKSHFIEYANEKYTYLLASERSQQPVAIGAVWCSGSI